jgi:putative ABC transport system permease protein
VMRIPLLRGRQFTQADSTGAAPVAIVGRTLAEELWPDTDPIGRRIRIAGGDDNPMRTIVGVVEDVRHDGLHLPVTRQVYLPHDQSHYPEPSVVLLVRARPGVEPTSLAPQIRDQIRATDPRQPVTRVQSYASLVADSVATRRFTLVLLSVFGVTALLLAVIGLYGVLAYIVTQRHREIGLRVALGAGRREIRALIVRQGMTPAAAGLVAGLLLSVAGSRLIESMLYGTAPTDVLTLVAVGVVMMLSALMACVLPARSAARVDPAITLKAAG